MKKRATFVAVISCRFALGCRVSVGACFEDAARPRTPRLRCRMQICGDFENAFDGDWMRPGWCCCSLRLDQVVCGGPPQPSSSWRGTRSERSVCWLFGSRSLRPTGRSPSWRYAGDGFGTVERASFGTGNIWWQRN